MIQGDEWARTFFHKKKISKNEKFEDIDIIFTSKDVPLYLSKVRKIF
jgi:hypothetical protein